MKKKGPITSVAPHWDLGEITAEPQCLINFGKEGKATAFLSLRVSHIIQNSQHFSEVSNNWDTYNKGHPKCSHDMKKCLVGMRTVRLQDHFWKEAGGTQTCNTDNWQAVECIETVNKKMWIQSCSYKEADFIAHLVFFLSGFSNSCLSYYISCYSWPQDSFRNWK